jgi:hypothetical protein
VVEENAFWDVTPRSLVEEQAYMLLIWLILQA